MNEYMRMADRMYNLDNQSEQLKKKNEELERENERLNGIGYDALCNLSKAKEHIRTLISCLIDWVQEGDDDYCYITDAEQFLKEIEKC